MDKNNIETIVPLLPMQMAFLWHNLKPGNETGVLQLRCSLAGNINIHLLQNAWQQISDKHQALRSSIHWNNVKSPVQVVMKSQTPQWHFVDLRTHENADRTLRTYVQSDKQTPLDLTQPPGYRLALFQVADDQFEFIWSLSHVMLDGWSCAIVVNDWVEAYSADSEIKSINPPLPLHDHARWLNQQDQLIAEAFWRAYLSGVSSQRYLPHWQNETSLQLSSPLESTHADSINSCKTKIESADFSALKACLRETGVTLGVALQGAWATLIKSHPAQQHAVFGVTVSGRQIELSHMGKRVGMMINLIPVVVNFTQTGTFANWLAQLQQSFFSVIPHAHVSMQKILQSTTADKPAPLTGLNANTKDSLATDGGRLFESLLVLENQPEVVSSKDIKLSNLSSGIQSDFDLTVVIIQSDELAIELIYNPKHFEPEDIQNLSQRFTDLLRNLPAFIDAPADILEQQYGSYDSRTGSHIAGSHPQVISQDNSAGTVLSPLERQLLAIWNDILGIGKLSLEDNFFDLGGTSLQAVQIFERLESELNIKLPPTVLFNAATVGMLAATINQKDPLSFWSTTVEIQRNGDKPPLFVPVNSADMLMYRNLSEELGNSQPVYGFRSSDSSLSTEDLATTLVEHIVAIEPRGPYFIAGMSGAGLLAWLIAQKLEQQNRPVALLALLDAYGPDYPTLLPPVRRLASVTAHFSLQSLRFVNQALKRKFAGNKLYSKGSASSTEVESNMHRHVGYQKQIAQEQEHAKRFLDDVSKTKPIMVKMIDRIILKITSVRYRSFNLRMAFIVFVQGLLLEHRRNHGSGAVADNQPALREMQERYEKMYGALVPYGGKILYFRCSERPPTVKDDAWSGWEKLVDNNMTIYPIPGSHTTLLQQPNVAVLASILGREIAAIGDTEQLPKGFATSPCHYQAQYAGDNA